MNTAHRTMHLLGYAGLIPFVAVAVALILGVEHRLLSLSVINAYAFGIFCFLCGSWWGLGLPRDRREALVFSNLLFLVAFFVFSLASEWWPLTACLLLVALFVIEQSGRIVPFASAAYRRMRGLLTLIAAGSMLSVHLTH